MNRYLKVFVAICFSIPIVFFANSGKKGTSIQHLTLRLEQILRMDHPIPMAMKRWSRLPEKLILITYNPEISLFLPNLGGIKILSKLCYN